MVSDDEFKSTTRRIAISVARSVNMGSGEFIHLKVREEVVVEGTDLEDVVGYRKKYLRSVLDTIREEVADLRKEGR